MYIMPFKSAFGCFKGVVVYLSCIWLFLRADLAFFAYDYLATLVTGQKTKYFFGREQDFENCASFK